MVSDKEKTFSRLTKPSNGIAGADAPEAFDFIHPVSSVVTAKQAFVDPAAPATDVFIAGAGPAGLAAAIAAALRGLTVEVADSMTPPIDKACGEGLMPDTLTALTELGVDVASAPSAPLHGIRFLGTPDAHGDYPTTEALFPARQGRGIKRPILHQLLYERALQLGVRFHWETVVQGIDVAASGLPQTIRTNRSSITARFIVGADGHQSRIRAWAGLDRSITSARRVGLRQHFAFAPWTHHVEVYWSDHGQAYVTPISPDEVCVAFVSRTRHANIESSPESLPGASAPPRLALHPATHPQRHRSPAADFHPAVPRLAASHSSATPPGSVDAVAARASPSASANLSPWLEPLKPTTSDNISGMLACGKSSVPDGLHAPTPAR